MHQLAGRNSKQFNQLSVVMDSDKDGIEVSLNFAKGIELQDRFGVVAKSL